MYYVCLCLDNCILDHTSWFPRVSSWECFKRSPACWSKAFALSTCFFYQIHWCSSSPSALADCMWFSGHFVSWPEAGELPFGLRRRRNKKHPQTPKPGSLNTFKYGWWVLNPSNQLICYIFTISDSVWTNLTGSELCPNICIIYV